MLSCLLLSTFISFSQTINDPLEWARDLRNREKFEDALYEVNNLIEHDSTVADYYDLRGDVLFNLKKYEEAFADFNKAIALNAKEPIFYHHRATYYYASQIPDKAIEDNNSALKYVNQDSLKYGIILNRGACYTMMRDFQKAYDDYHTVLQFDSTNQAALTNIGAVLDELGRSDESIRYLKKVIELYPDFVGGYGNLAFQYMQKGKYKEALELDNKVLQLDPDEPLGYNNRGFVKYKLGDLKGAMEDINHSLKIYPGNSYAYKNRALVFIAMKQPSKACVDLHTAIDLGFTQMYGDEVQKLLEKYCSK
jgi:tetratricopeptide (TPR) repeat protein